MSDVAQKSHSQIDTPSSSSAEERVYVDQAIRELDAILRNERKCFAEDSDADEFLGRVTNARLALSKIGHSFYSRVPTGGEPEQDHGAALTEGATACPLVPAAQLSHDGAEKWRSMIRFVFFGNSTDTEKLSDDELQTRLCESWDAIQVERDHFSAELKRLVGLLPVSRMEQSSGKFRVARDSDQKCQCGHPQSAHFGVGGMCLGEFRKRDPEYPVVECACQSFHLVGSGTQSLSDSEPVSAQERSAKNTHSQLVPSLPSADGSIAQARAEIRLKRIAVQLAAGDMVGSLLNGESVAQRAEKAHRHAEALDALILLCQSEAQQEKEKKELGALCATEGDAHPRSVHAPELPHDEP